MNIIEDKSLKIRRTSELGTTLLLWHVLLSTITEWTFSGIVHLTVKLLIRYFSSNYNKH